MNLPTSEGTTIEEVRKAVDLLKKRPLIILVEREMFMPWFKISLPNGQSEELDAEETKQWFKVRGANMPSVDKALDHAWNFKRCIIEIENPKEPPVLEPAVQPRL